MAFSGRARVLLWGVASLFLGNNSVCAIYPDDHFNHVTKIDDAEHLSSVINNNIDAGKTLFAPSWNTVTKAFAEAGNTDVSFADVNLRETPIRGPPYNPGVGGWPTIRFFNQDTGPEGAPYTKKTNLPICQELGDLDLMRAYIEQAGGTKLEAEGIAVGGEADKADEL